MKKLIIILSALALISGCANLQLDEPVQEETVDIVVDKVSDLPDVIHASVSDDKSQNSDPQSRTYVGKENSVLWHTSDAISYFAGENHNAKYVFNGETGSKSADFDLTSEGTPGSEMSVVYGVYPYNENTKVEVVDGVETLKVVYPSEQTYAESSFGKGANVMVAAGINSTDDNLYFRNACGYLVIKLTADDEKIKTIKLTAHGGAKIAGEAHIVAKNDAEPVITMSDNATSVITMYCNDLVLEPEKTYEFWFALPPVTLSDGIEILVEGGTFTTKKFVKNTTRSIEIQRNVPQPMAVLNFTSNTPCDNELWYRRSGENNTTGKGFDFSNEDFNAPIVTSQTFYNSVSGYHVVRVAESLTEINNGVFEGTDITEIILPETLQTIGESAFEACENLTEIIIPGSVTSIGDNAFYECTSLSGVTFKSGSQPLSIGYQDGASDEGPFYTSPLTYIYLDRDLNPSEEYAGQISACDEGIFAIEGYDNVSTTVKLGNNVKTIHDYMFAYLPITSLTIPGSVNAIGNNVFRGCTSLASISFMPSPTNTNLIIGFDDDGEDDNLFNEICPLTTLYLDREMDYRFSETVDSHSEGLFGELPTLTSVTLGSQVKTLQPYMFAGSSITSITIPATVDYIHEYAFDGCDKLTTLEFKETSTPLNIKGQGDSYGPFYDSPLTTIDFNRNFNHLNLDGTTHTHDDEAEGIFAISSSARNSVTASPSTVNIGPLIKNIPGYMFCNLPITELTIPGTVEYISNYVFNGCTRLNSLVFEPSQVVPNLIPLVIGEPDDPITGEGPFSDCPLASVDYNRYVSCYVDDLDSEDKGMFARPTLKEVTIGEQVLVLSSYLLSGSSITSINIPNTVATIGKNVFSNCDKLATLNIEDGSEKLYVYTQTTGGGADWGPFYDSPLTTAYLGRDVAYKCSYENNDFTPEEWSDGFFASEDDVETLTVTLTENVKTISKFMFARRPITEITVPASVELIDDYAFYDCTSLSKITFTESTTPLNIGFQPFNNEVGPFYQSPLTEINLNRQLNATYASKLDQNDEGIFSCSSRTEAITKLAMNNLTSISDYMFYGMNLESIEIPVSVTSIGNKAFAENPNLRLISLRHKNAPTLGNDVFDGHKEGDLNFNVNPSALDQYTGEANWPQADIGIYYRGVPAFDK